MQTHNRTNILHRTLAMVGATGTAALMALPVLAQAVPTQGVVNNGDTMPSAVSNPSSGMTSDRCASYMKGGMGGSTDSQSSMMNQPRYQFDANNRSAAVAYRANGPAGTSGRESVMNLEVYRNSQTSYPTAYNLSSSQPQAAATLPADCAGR
ncbi:MAG TPA: hypothetical protein VL134_06190 [Leptolyngbya sp.]|jgi:hypothetical protein|nr:hypothetical protein [Leptolyngbya sp.]